MEFKGCNTPEVYIIDHHSHDEDIVTGYPVSGQRGSYICSLLGSMGLLGVTRFACWTEQGPDIVKEDISKTNPKVIVGLGSEMLKELTGSPRSITEMSGNVFDIKINDIDYKYVAMLSPSYVLRRIEDSNVTLRFSQDLYRVFQIVNGEYKDILKEKRILSAHSYEEFVEKYNEYLKDSPDVSYDIETNARPPMSEDSQIIGFSVGDKETGIYVSVKSLDFNMSQEEEDRIWDFLINEVFEKKNKLIIHNTMYERPYTLCCKDYEIKFDKADDTLVMARLLRSPKEGAGLKYQSQKYLHYPDWETDLGRYISGYRGFVSRVGFGPKKYTWLWEEITSDLSKRGVMFIEDYERYQELSELDKLEIKELSDAVRSPCIELYTEEEIENVSRLLTKRIIDTVNEGGIKDSTIPYNDIPDKVLSKYGAVDALATYDLREYFFDIMDKESTDKVDLHKGYQNWLEHMYVAYIMERNGLCWNEDLVKKDEAFLTNQATECLRSMIKSELFKPFIRECCEYKYKPLILSDYLPMVAERQGFTIKDYSIDTGKYTLYYNGKRCAKGRISEIEILEGTDEYDTYMRILSDMFYEYVDNAKSFEELKDIYNPASSTSSHIPRKIFMTEDLQIGGKVNELNTLARSPEFEELVDSLPTIDQKFLKVSKILCDPEELKSSYGDQWAMYRKQFYEGFKTLLRVSSGDVVTPEIKEIINKKENVVIESFDDGGVIDIYNAYIVTGIDQDDRSTWSPVFEWIINFRLFKKSQKLITSYINGTVGRQSVYVVDNSDFDKGSNRIKRKRNYFDGPNPGVLKDNEAFILNAKWSPNTAETGRWRSAQHTVPWGSQIKKYYTSRFYGGTLVCPDYSQMEVRTLAAVSHDKNMLDLFYRGDDFHTETAKKIYRKDEVTTAERRFSKTATFSLLYGAMEESFAKNYCKGDLDYAKMVYGGFFEAYPGVQEWIKERHEEVQKDHRVSLELSNRFIPIEPDGEGKGALNSMLRKAQNYPIQSQSADLTGCVIYDLQKYIEDNNLNSKVIMYVHDSIEIDIPPFEMIQFINQLKFVLNDSPKKRMGLPSKADVALGCSLGHEIEMESLEHNEEFTECTMVLNGYKDEIEETVAEWKKVYKTVEVSEENWKELYVSMGELFILRKAFTPTLGTTRHKGTCKVHIKYYD